MFVQSLYYGRIAQYNIHTHMYIFEKGKKRTNQHEMCKLGVLALLSGNNGNVKLIKDKSSFGLSSFSF